MCPLFQICPHADTEHIPPSSTDIKKGCSYEFTSPFSFMVCVLETVSVSGCEDGVGSFTSEYGSVL